MTASSAGRRRRPRSLRFFELGIRRLLLASHRRPWLTLAAGAAFFGLLALKLPGLRLILDFTELLDQHSEAYLDESRLAADFEPGHALLIGFETKRPEGFSDGDLCAIKGWIDQETWSNGQILRYFSTFQLRRPEYADDRLLFPLRIRLTCGQAAGTQAMPAAWPDGQDHHNGILHDANRRYLLVGLVLKDSEDQRHGRLNPEDVRPIADSLQHAFGAKDTIEALIGGPAGLLYHMQQGIEHDNILNLALIAVIFVLYRFLFGSWRGGLILVCGLLLMGISLFGLMTWLDWGVDLLSQNLFIVVSVATLQDFLFLANEHKAVQDKDWFLAFRRIVVPSFYTTLTTMIGFGSLFISDLTNVSRFGLLAAFAALVEWTVVFLLTPALMQVVPRARAITCLRKARDFPFFGRMESCRLPRPLAWTLFIVVIPGLFLVSGMKTQDSWEGIFPEKHEFSRSLAAAKKHLGWNAHLKIVLPEFSSEADNRRTLAEISLLPEVVTVRSIYDDLDVFKESVPEPLRPVVESKLLLSDESKSALTDGRHGAVAADLFLQDSRVPTLATVIDAVRGLCGQSACYTAGGIKAFSEFSREFIPTLIGSFGTSILLLSGMLAILGWGFSFRQLFALMAASFWGVFVALNAFTFLKLPVNFSSSIFAAVLEGVTGDNAIQYIYGSPGRDLKAGIDARARGSIDTLLFILICAGVFFFSAFEMSRTFSLIFMIGYLAAVVGDLYLLRGLLPAESTYKNRQ